MAGRVVVVGSVNRDVTVATERFPRPGETVLGSGVTHGLGGKGANQAVAAARAGAHALIVGTVGADRDGAELRASLADHGVDTSRLATASEAATGSAHILVDPTGENEIVVVPGANALTRASGLGTLAPEDVLVLQGEVPRATIQAAIEAGRDAGCRVVLNLAPAIALPATALAGVDVLVVNESEAGSLLGAAHPRTVEEARVAAARLRGLGPRQVVVTLGAAGAVLAADGGTDHVPAPRPRRVVDTTGAGDATVGVLAAGVAAGHARPDALRAAVVAGTLSVERPGAAASYPRFALGDGGRR